MLALRTGHLYPQEIFFISVRIKSKKNSNNSNRNRTRDLASTNRTQSHPAAHLVPATLLALRVFGGTDDAVRAEQPIGRPNPGP